MSEENAMRKLHVKKMNMRSCMGKSVTISLLPLELCISVEYTQRDMLRLHYYMFPHVSVKITDNTESFMRTLFHQINILDLSRYIADQRL